MRHKAMTSQRHDWSDLLTALNDNRSFSNNTNMMSDNPHVANFAVTVIF